MDFFILDKLYFYLGFFYIFNYFLAIHMAAPYLGEPQGGFPHAPSSGSPRPPFRFTPRRPLWRGANKVDFLRKSFFSRVYVFVLGLLSIYFFKIPSLLKIAISSDLCFLFEN